MKAEFPEYFLPSDEEFKVLWAEAFIVFDANILLNLYLYGSSTRDSILKDLSKLEERLWIPAQVAEEYLRNRVSKIEQQHEVYRNIYQGLKEITSTFEKLLGNVTKHPTLDKDSIRQGFNRSFKKIEKVIRDQEALHKTEFIQNIHEDAVLNQLSELYKAKVGRRWTHEELKVIFKEGEERYKYLVPPGYKDKRKDKVKNENQEEVTNGKKYGDLILWKQILEWSKNHDKPVIFVTEDSKEDWWQIDSSGKTLGPRPELIAEHYSITNKAFYMYKPEVFWKYASERLDSTTSIESLEEIERVSKVRNRVFHALDPGKYYALSDIDRLKLFSYGGAIDAAKLLGIGGAIDAAKLLGIGGAIDAAKLLGIGGAIDAAKLLGIGGAIDAAKLLGIGGAIDAAKLLGIGGSARESESELHAEPGTTKDEEDDDSDDGLR